MEKHVAILMADLSGYTALTETHGSLLAADLIDKYIHIAKNCLVGDSKMHQRHGDEIMFISDSPDYLLATAIKLEAHTAREENFLQIHGGLHFGKVLYRTDSYFGSSINLVSRIAAKAAAGTFWCSDEFVNALKDKSVCRFKSTGSHRLKNLTDERELFELSIAKSGLNFVDPVCRMLIQNLQRATRHPKKEDLYFCSSQCLELYRQNYNRLQTI